MYQTTDLHDPKLNCLNDQGKIIIQTRPTVHNLNEKVFYTGFKDHVNLWDCPKMSQNYFHLCYLCPILETTKLLWTTLNSETCLHNFFLFL